MVDELVIRCQSFESIRKPLPRHHKSLATWMNNYKPLARSESNFVTHDEDFIALADGQEGGWFDSCVENMLRLLPHKLSRVSCATVVHPNWVSSSQHTPGLEVQY